VLTGCAPAAWSAFSAPLTVASQPFNPRSKKPLSPSTPPKHHDLGRQASLIGGAELQGTVPLWAWIGDEAATTFSY